MKNKLDKRIAAVYNNCIEGEVNMICPECSSQDSIRKGSYKTKTGKVKRYQCNCCQNTFTKRTYSKNYHMKKQYLQSRIVRMYCERMSLRGIARALGVNIKTVVRYFIKASKEAEIRNLKRLENREIITSYIQFDELETFEHTKKRPLGVLLFIRAKTGEILSAKVSRSPIRALSMSKKEIVKYNSKVNKKVPMYDGFIMAKKAANKAHTTVACDGYRPQVDMAKKICSEDFIDVNVLSSENKKIDLAILKLRQDVSRLGRKSLCTTKKMVNLQRHLDLYIDYNNHNRVQAV